MPPSSRPPPCHALLLPPLLPLQLQYQVGVAQAPADLAGTDWFKGFVNTLEELNTTITDAQAQVCRLLIGGSRRCGSRGGGRGGRVQDWAVPTAMRASCL